MLDDHSLLQGVIRPESGHATVIDHTTRHYSGESTEIIDPVLREVRAADNVVRQSSATFTWDRRLHTTRRLGEVERA